MATIPYAEVTPADAPDLYGEGGWERDVRELMATQAEAHVATIRGVQEEVGRLAEAAETICDAFAAGRHLYTFGNGGSAADAQHLAAEMIGRYKRDRRPLPAVALTTDPSVVTCIANDYSASETFARQVRALARPGDVVTAFTTSGRSPNVVHGLETARLRGAVTLLFTGGTGGEAIAHADHAFVVESTETARIQEAHLLMLHLISEWVDAWVLDAPEADEYE